MRHSRQRARWRSGGRKQRDGGFCSKMSDKVDAFPVLRQPEILAVTHLPGDVIPQFCKAPEHGRERAPLTVIDQAFDVFQDKKARLEMPQDADDFKKELAARVGKAALFSQDAKALARKSADDEVDGADGVGVEGADVAMVGVGEVEGIDAFSNGVDLGVSDKANGYPGLAEAELEAPDPAEEGKGGDHKEQGEKQAEKQGKKRGARAPRWKARVFGCCFVRDGTRRLGPDCVGARYGGWNRPPTLSRTGFVVGML